MERLLLVRCPELLVEDECGEMLRTFAQVVEAVRTYCPWVTVVRPGVCTLPTRGPARFFGGEPVIVGLVHNAALSVTGVTIAEVGVAEGLFAADLAAQVGLLVARGETAAFLEPWPVATLQQPELEDLLRRLGIHSLGAFAQLPERHVLARLGSIGAVCHRLARALDGELPGLRQPAIQQRLDQLAGEVPPAVRQVGFWGGHSDADAWAARSLTAIQQLLGPDAVQVAHRQGGRSPTEQVRFVTWTGSKPSPLSGPEPWPGQIPSPAPATVYAQPARVEVVGDDGQPVVVTSRGSLSAPPSRLSISGGPWTALSAWAGPWPTWERWWKPSRRRAARLQVVTSSFLAHLLTAQKGQWWLSATYD
jgi:hypothetical protein